MKTLFNYYKNQILRFGLILAIMVLAGSCTKFLDRKPLGQPVLGDVKQATSQAEQEIFGLYNSLKPAGFGGFDGMTGFFIIPFHAARSDDAINSTPGDGTTETNIADHFIYSTGAYALQRLWEDHLSLIIQCSGAIKDLEATGVTTPANLSLIAEAKFLRAYSYFDMVKDFGDVPKIDFKVFSVNQANVPRAPAAVIYSLIDSDLNYAIKNLPVTWDPKFIGRVTQGTATTLLAKAKLYRKDWAGALATAETVINSGKYALLPNYADVFRDEHKNSSEIIFAIQNYENSSGKVVFSNYHGTFQGIRGAGVWNLGFGWNLPSPELVNNAYEPNDPRKGQTILFSGAYDDTLINDGLYHQRLPVSTNPYFNKKFYSDPARRASTGDFGASWLDLIILRYADVLLMAAEAANESGNSGKAAGYLEQVRSRARNGNPAILPQITALDQGTLRDAIKHERRVEFAMEYERFYDLVRWGDAEKVLGPLGYTTKNALLPVPQVDLDLSNGVLKQTPGY